jgi:predicted permease
VIRNYFRTAWRSLTKRKGFAIINILGLSLGFGCSILIFLFVQYHLQFDNFHYNQDRIYRFNTEEHRDFIDYEASVPPGFSNAFKTDYDYAEKIAKVASRDEELFTITNTNDKQQFLVDVAYAEADLFRIFNYPLLNGSNEVPITEPNTAVITELLAHKLYGEANPVNQTFTLNNQELITVTGVLKDLPKTTLIRTQAFISYETLKAYDEFLSSESWGGINSSLQCFALLRPNQDVSEIEEAIAGYVQKYRPDSKNVHQYKLQPLADIHFNSQYSGGMDPEILWIFSLTGLFILVVACINFINISTAQSSNRSKEVGVRKVLGSFKGQLFRQFMAEALIIVVMALLLGFGMCLLVLPFFNSVFGLELSSYGLLNMPFLGFIASLLLLVTLMAGSYPGLLLSRIAPALALKRKLTQKDAGGYLTRKTLVVTQFVISIVLIIACIVVSKQLKYAINSDLGFDKTGVVMVGIPEETDPIRLRGLKSRIAQASGVEQITSCFASPGAGENSWGSSVRYNGDPEAEDFNLQVKAADRDYLNTFNLRLVAGRNFYEKDTVDEVLVNEDFVRKVGASGPEEVLGKAIDVNTGLVRGNIVGVIADFHDRDFRNSINPVFIAPDPRLYNELAVKINLNNAQNTLGHIENEWSALFPDYVFEYDFLNDRVAELYEAEQRFLSLLGIFSGLAIFIGCLGIYGLVLFFVVQKTKEIGIRKVLGGNVAHILALVVQDFLKLIALAGIIATPLAWYFMNRWLQNFEYKTTLSWWVFVLAVALVVLVTLLTISYQALKAARLNPVKSLRME